MVQSGDHGGEASTKEGCKEVEEISIDSDLAFFKAERNFITRLMNKARREFYRSFIDKYSGDQKKLLRASQRLLNRTIDDGLTPTLDSGTFFNDLGEYFVQKVDTIRTQLDTEQQTDLLPEMMVLRLLFLMTLCYHSLLLWCYQFEMFNSLSTTHPLNPSLLTLCHPHQLANVRISTQFSQKSSTTHCSPGFFLTFGKRL